MNYLKKSCALTLIFYIFLFFFISCENSINSYDSNNKINGAEDTSSTSPAVRYANVSGTFSTGDALPSQLAASISPSNTNNKSRSAIAHPHSEHNNSHYYVIARDVTEGKADSEREGPVNGQINDARRYSVSGLKIGVTWQIEVGVSVKNEGATEWQPCIYAKTKPKAFTEEDNIISEDLVLISDMTEGYGAIDLSMTLDNSIDYFVVNVPADKLEIWQTAYAADTGNLCDVDGTSGHIKIKSIPAGVYNLGLGFYKSNGILAYYTEQTICVVKGMLTETWVSNGTALFQGSGLSTSFNLTDSLINSYIDSVIYVGQNSYATSIGVTARNSNEGRAYSPLASMNEAIKRIRNANVRRDYKIFVSGSISENIKIGGEGADVLPGTAASSITIQGLNNNNADDVLMAPRLSTAPCLSIQTDIPVIFKNIKITTVSNGEYNTSAQGGGLYIKTGADAPGVTLDSGALIDNCIISGTGARGAGIYLDSGKLTIKTGAKISNNHFPNSDGFGGGIYIKSGAELILSGSFDIPYGGSVTQNDIYVEAADSIKIKNAISPQAGTSGAMATITPAAVLGRNTSIVSLASGSSLSSITPYKDYFALSNDDWLLKANSAGNALVIDAPIYVAGGESTRQVCTSDGSESGNGTKSAPFATIEQAVNAISALNVRDEYSIYIDGEISDAQTIPVSFTSDKASSLTIQGASGNTSDSLTGSDAGSFSVLTISSPVPVTIKDLKITGGNNIGFGGGINMISGSTVTLENGALIGGTSGSTAASDTEHSANYAAKGGGIYSEGNLTLKNGSAVTYNYAFGNDDENAGGGGGIYCNGGSLTIEAGAKVNLNGTYNFGGGISIKGTAFSMTGGEVCNNISNSGAGGLYITKNSSDYCPALITISGAKISNNSADDDGSSGGIFYSGGQTLAITGNTEISGNHCKFEGGGIRVAPGVLDLSDCTISGNYSNNGTRPGGGIAANAGGSIKLSGSVYIPAGATIGETFRTGNGCNDVRQNYGSIKIKGALTPPSECTDGIIATITPNAAVRGTALLEAEGSVTDLTSYKDYFALTQAGWNLNLSADKKTLSLDSPIYVAGRSTKYICTAFGSDEDSADGTSAAPFATIKKAIELINSMNDSNQNYTIWIDGEILSTFIGSNPAGQDIGGEIRALSLTIKGANGLDDNGNPKDIINGRVEGENRNARAITINTSVPITLECLKITGGLADDGGAISLDGFNGSVGNLTLSNDILITENKANATGGGLYIYAGSILNVIGNVVIEGNTNTANPALPSNLYLQDGQKITVAGALTNGDKKARIFVNTQTTPSATEAVDITNNYAIYNANVDPVTYFHSDSYAVLHNASGEACLKASGGNITVDPIYEDIKISIDKSLVYLAEESKTFTFTASAKDSNGNNVTVSPGTGTGKVAYSYTVTYHGELLTSGTHFTPGDDVNLNTLTLSNSLPEGNYTINVVAIYNGNTYCAEFIVTLKEYLDVQGSDGTEISDFMRTSTAKYLKVKFTNDYGIKAPDIPESEKQSSGYYDSDMKLDYSCIIPAGKTLELTSDVPVTIKCNAVYYMFKVSGTLIIGENVKLTGSHLVPSERSIIHGHLINIYSGGKVILDGGTITNGVGAGSISSHAIEIQNRGTLIINSGYITNGNGGGGAVQVNSGGKVEMYGGEISDNIARGGKTGGVTVRNNGTFIKSGGVIKNNTLSGNPSQLYVFAGGKYGTSENNLVTYSEDYEVTDEL